MSRLLPLIYLVVEIASFIALGRWIGYGWAVLLVMGLFLFGVVFAAFEFQRVYRRTLVDTSKTLTRFGGTDPERAIKRSAAGAGRFFLDSAILLVGSILLALPGVVSTVVGFITVLPPTRWLLRKIGPAWLLGWFQRQGDRGFAIVSRYGQGPSPFSRGSVPPAPDNTWDDEQYLPKDESGK